MSNWMNDEGEPYMTAAELRFEAELDEQSAAERYLDDDQFFGEEPEDCDPFNSYCVNDDDDCETCAQFWLEFHAEGALEDAAMEFGLFGSEA